MENKEQLVEEILSRSIASVLPTKESLKEVLMSDKKLRIYIGADATGPQLHLGHATNFMLLERFRKLGHEVIVLFGDFTAMLGDPSERAVERKALTKEEVEKISKLGNHRYQSYSILKRQKIQRFSKEIVSGWQI